ncbi:ATP synthase, H transporting, mitochondrial F1 complex, O subunit [Pycnococcus provasolii]|uniref:ATP synthase, H transporting, mitochondrial F1 complex, O subunit n=1 Tax=Pycnococcus provasolii TaxID=41880 RepID=A0A830HLF7_9CHLO|nr:ATP synthase, H transporting, mitochondrial F1 complex, O subunit [Pycnococcus provasolii]
MLAASSMSSLSGGGVVVGVVRPFSASASASAAAAEGSGSPPPSKKVSAPIKMFDLDGRYATALYQAAASQNKLDAVKRDFESLVQAAKGSPTFTGFCMDPVMSRDKKTLAISSLAADFKVDNVTANFLKVLAENGRLNSIFTISERFEEQVNASSGTFVVKVTSASEVAPDGLAALEKIVKENYVDANAKVKLDVTVDESIMGGFKLQIGERMIDKSVATKLNQLEQALHKM